MSTLPMLTRKDVAKPIPVYQSTTNPLIFKYILPNNTVSGLTIFNSLEDAKRKNSFLVMNLMKDGDVARVIFSFQRDTQGNQFDAVQVMYANAAAAAGRAKSEAAILDIAANVRPDGTLKNPKLALIASADIRTDDFTELKAAEYRALKDKFNDLNDDDLLHNTAAVRAVVYMFARSASHPHGGDIKVMEYGYENGGTLKVEFQSSCASCRVGQDMTRNNLVKLLNEVTPGLVQKLVVA